MSGIVIACLALGMALALVRAARRPTVFDRILAVNAFGTLTVLLITVMSEAMGRIDFLDLALVYALMNFIGVIAILRFAKYGFFAGSAPEDPH
ncbi:MAG: monovalent cation/H+ antiporter complex subunit F [Planctomycetota bacterium]